MSKVRNLPEITTLADDDLFYVVDNSAGPNGGRKIKKSNLTATAEAHALSHRPGGSDALVTAAPIIVNANSSNDEGVSTSFSRADHKHDVATGVPVSQTPDQTNDAGVSSNLARADHVHNIPATAPTTNLSPATTNSEGVAASFARGDHTHAIETSLVADITTVSAGASSSAGTVDKYARGDHRHSISTAVPTTQNPDQANAEGVSTSLARADHIHNIPADAPTTTLSPATTNSEGSGTSFTRNDHTHAIATALVGDITTIQPDDTASAGTSDTFVRGDHRHAIVTAAPSNTGTANSEGSSTSFARADHIHNTVISNQGVSSDTADTTTSLTDVLIAGMSITPASGTYLVIFSSSTLNSGNGAERNYVSIYSGGTQVVGTERRVGVAGGAVIPISAQAVVTVNGSQAIETRWRVIAGTGTMYQRRMSLIRLG